MLYHVSIVKLEDSQLKFTPRVPTWRIENENDAIERICVSDSIEGCLRGIEYNITKSLWMQYNEEYQIPLYVYAIDENKLSKEELYTPEYLVENNLVPDAQESNEHWILKPVKFELVDTIKLSEEMYSIYEDNEIDYVDTFHFCFGTVNEYLKNNEFKYTNKFNENKIYKIKDIDDVECYDASTWDDEE